MDQNDRMARAEDYVFGIMDDATRARAERDMVTDAEFRSCVMMVAERLRGLHRGSQAQAAIPDKTWREIGARISAMPQMAAMGAAPARHDRRSNRPEVTNTIDSMQTERHAAAKLLHGLPYPTQGRAGFRQAIAHWSSALRACIAAACLVAAMGIGYLAGKAASPLPPIAAIAILNSADGVSQALVEVTTVPGLRLVMLGELDVPADKMLALWAQPAIGDQRMMLLGVLTHPAEAVLHPESLPAPLSGLSFAITLEDAQDISATTPRGPVVASGTARPALP